MIEVPVTKEACFIAVDHAWNLLDACNSNGYKTKAKTTVCNKCQGKRNEVVFWQWLKSRGIKIVHSPLRADYSKLDGKDDFVVESASGNLITIELKGTNGIDYNGKPKYSDVLFPLHQHIDHNYDFVVFVGQNGDLSKMFLLGWTMWSEVDRCHRDRSFKIPAIRVPFSILRPMDELVRGVL